MKRISLILTILLVLTLLVGASALAQGSDNAQGSEPDIALAQSPDSSFLKVQTADSESAVYIVVLDAPALPSYRGGIPGLPPTNPEARGEQSLDANSPASIAYREYLTTRREEVLERADQAIGRHLDVRYIYEASLNGFAVKMIPEEAIRLAQVQGVKYVEEERISYPLTDAGPAWVGAPRIWDGTATGGLPGTYGEGIVVGVIDTGIDPWNPSFADIGGDSYDHTNPYGSGVYVGVCDPNNTGGDGVVAYDSTFPCNDKLIGVWGYTDSDENPRDTDGHGSHTASTSAGNFVDDTVIETETATFMADISGVAPHANIIAYDGCSDDGGCPGSSLEKARDQAILDGVHVINYSIGSPAASGNPWRTDSESESWLNVRAAGIFAATSAGNDGPGPNTVGSPADLPWITSVGAASHNRTFLNSITLDDGANPPLTINGQSMTGELSAPVPVVLSKDITLSGTVDPEDARLCAKGDSNNPESPWPAGTFSGEIVVCERGKYGRVDKGKMVMEAGAGGYVLAQPNEFGGGTGSLVADPHVLPAVHIDYYNYQDLLTYLNSAPGIVDGTIAGSTRAVDDAYGDIMASFSSRGPNSSDPLADILIPKVIAPGRSIWAAYHQGGGDGDYTYNVIGGTSMSSPHVAGTGALMMALHPDWTTAEIESALMTTAAQDILNDDGISQADPFAMGSGRVDLSKAGEAGLVLDVTTAEFQSANPDLDGDPKMLNLASLGNASCNSYCKWTRTVRNPTDTTMTWTGSYSGDGSVTVTPSNFTLAPGATASFEVRVDVSGLTIDEWYFGDVVWVETSSAAPDAHLTLGVKARPPAPRIELNPASLTNTQPPDFQLDHALQVENVGTADLTWNIYEANAPAMASLAGPEAVTGIREVFWNQPNDGNSGMSSTYETDNGNGTYVADDFIPEKNTQLTEIVTYGFMNDADLPDAELIEWYIYPDSGGAPAGYPEDGGGSEIWTFSALPTATGVDITSDNIGLDLEAAGAPIPNLMAGVTYWLVVFPHMDSSIDNWYWLQGTPQASHGWYMDLVVFPFPIWRNLDTLTSGAISDVAFRLTGIRESVCDTPGDIPWISSVTPSSGTTGDEQATAVAVNFDSSGLTAGDYEATLCVDSNDADRPLIELPVTLSVDSTCSGTTPVEVVVSIEQDGADALLSWEDDETNKGGYQIYRSNSPYFAPDVGTKVGDPLPVGTTEYRDTGAVGNPGSNYYYIVQALNCDQSQTANSERLAEFDFGLVAGDAP